MRPPRQLQCVQCLPEVWCVGTLVNRVIGIGLGIDRDEYHMRKIAIAEGIDQLDESALLHCEVDCNSQSQVIDQPAIDEMYVGSSHAIEVGERILQMNR